MQVLPRSVSVLSAIVLMAFSACGGGSSPVPTSTSTPSSASTTTTLTTSTGVLVFPSASGSSGSASYTLTATPTNGTTLTLSTQSNGNGLPIPLGSNASVLVAFSITTNQSVPLAKFPGWQVTPPTNTTLTPPYGVEVFDGSSNVVSYAATVTGSSITALAFGAPYNLVPGNTYVFEIVQNPLLSQIPSTK